MLEEAKELANLLASVSSVELKMRSPNWALIQHLVKLQIIYFDVI